jgi:hypothetical protein
MCTGGGKAPPPAPPPPPPPAPAPMLDQSAPATAAPDSAELQNRRAEGTKKYRRRNMDIQSSNITTTPAGGLGIPTT